MTPALSFFAAGTPVSQGGQKVAPSGRAHQAHDVLDKPGVWVLGRDRLGVPAAWRGKLVWGNDAKLRPWRGAIARAARAALGEREQLDGCLWVSCVFVFPWLKCARPGASASKNTAPDLDKLLRAVGDALERDAGVIKNDARIVGYPHAEKRYGNQPGVQVTIYTERAQ